MFTTDSVVSPVEFNAALEGWEMVARSRGGVDTSKGFIIYENEELQQFMSVTASGCSCCVEVDDVIDFYGSEMAYEGWECECITEDGEEYCGGACIGPGVYVIEVLPGLFSS